MNRKRISEIYDENGNIITCFVDLPRGFFYKDKFIRSERTLFFELEKDGYVGHKTYETHFTFRGNIYHHLQELVDDNEDISVPISILKTIYKDFGIEHSPSPKKFYWYELDEERYVYDSIGEVLNELENNMTDCVYVDSEIAEEDYIQDLTNDEIRKHLSKKVEERIKIISSWWNEKTSKRKGVSL